MDVRAGQVVDEGAVDVVTTGDEHRAVWQQRGRVSYARNAHRACRRPRPEVWVVDLRTDLGAIVGKTPTDEHRAILQ